MLLIHVGISILVAWLILFFLMTLGAAIVYLKVMDWERHAPAGFVISLTLAWTALALALILLGVQQLI